MCALLAALSVFIPSPAASFELRGVIFLGMESEEKRVKRARVLEARARNISHNVRCTECGSQSIEDSQADIAILLRKLIHNEIQAGKTDKEIFKKLEDDYGETVLYAPRFDMQTAVLWLSPVIVGGIAGGVWAYSKHRQNTNVHIMALNLVRGTSADIMKVGGYKLSALEIEATLLEHPAVSECCVLGLPDKDYGEAVSAIIVPELNVKERRAQELKPAISLVELCTWAKDKLAPYKLPTQLFLWDALPRNAMGKVNKKELKKKLAAGGH
ncbi:uncharacterized protein LOC131158423 [Malania oleifera]|uniref:uncharacterized protein LOC131158423 n=1 Tax=Malania oleifera TaxID=397392 RepID=UPI0025ADCC3C|nr:uncharacterized protein LOC131158423 [Malania oleifera]